MQNGEHGQERNSQKDNENNDRRCDAPASAQTDCAYTERLLYSARVFFIAVSLVRRRDA
jgi:hypothetical protein